MGGVGGGGRAGEACISEAFVVVPDVTPYSSDVTYRGPNVVNGYKLFYQKQFRRKSPAAPDLQDSEATEPFCVLPARFPKQLDIF